VSLVSTLPPPTYQWWFNAAALDPAVNPSAARAQLFLTNVTLGDVGGYYVVVSNNEGSVTSRTATLNVDPQFTKFTEGPVATDRVESWSGHFGDYDGDGLMDLVVTGDYSTPGSRNTRLYHNEGEGRFTAVTSGPWGTMSDPVFDGAWADPDNDGDLDLLLSVHESQTPIYLRNEGGGEFTRLPVDQNWFQPPVSLGGQTGSPAWGDLDNDGLLDGILQGPSIFPFRNLGNGQFTVLTNTPMYCLSEWDWAQSYQLVDYDNDGDLDVFLPREASSAKLYRNDGQLRFTDVSTAVLNGRVPRGAGGSWADFDNDGDLDVICAGGSPNSGVLLVNNGDGTFADWQGNPAALATAGGNWGIPTWGDYDNDGWLDLLTLTPGRLFHNLGDGNFEEITTGSPVKDTMSGTKSAAWADYDNNGTLDLFVARLNSAGNLLYQNNGNGRHWLKIRLKGTASNSHGIGARITVQATLDGKSVRQRRDISAGPIIQELEAHFGLGDATVAEVVRIEWPSGNVQELSDQAADRVLKITEPTPIQPPRPSASLGGAATLTGLGTGTYQWQFNGADLAGETKRTLALTNLQAAQQGRYSVVTTVADSSTRTNYAYLTIDTQFTKSTGPAATEPGCSWISSWGDYDGDGYPDLAVMRYPASQSAVYRNNGDGTFTTVPDIPWHTGQGYSLGLWGDFDNDGHQDFVSQRANQPTSVYFGDGRGSFTARQLQLGESWNIAVADYDQDGFLDLYASYGNHLFRNNGDRTFTRKPSQPQCGLPTTSTFGGALWADYDDDGALDLFCANHRGSSYLYHNNGQGCFTAVSSPVTRQALAGAWGDYDDDGRLDLCAASFGSTSYIYRNLGDGLLEPAKTGVTIQGARNSAVWVDYDNDGWLDLFFTGDATPKNALYRNLGNGTLSRVHIGSIAAESPGAGAPTTSGLWFDYNNDGFLDVYITAGDDYGSTRTPSLLYRNNGNSNSWLRVKLIGTVSNRDGIGAKVRVQARRYGRVHWQRRDISGGDAVNGHHLIAHFGLGNAVGADVVRIEWPSGIIQELTNVPVNQMLTVTEPPALEALGEGRIRLLCWARQNYELEVSDDLDNWTSLGVVATDQNRPVVLDPDAGQRPYRFYRTKGL
jgi:hypothetical protein